MNAREWHALGQFLDQAAALYNATNKNNATTNELIEII
jgi:hypothetical protein